MSAHCSHEDLDWANVLAEQIQSDHFGNNYKVANQKIASRLRDLKLEIEAETVHRLVAEADREDKSSAPYGEWCRDPKLCAGKGYCPRDPTCGD